MIYDEDRINEARRLAAVRAYTFLDDNKRVDAGYWGGYAQALEDILRDKLIEEKP